MPDPHAHAKANYLRAVADLDLPHDAHLDPRAIVNCTLCDDNGYRGGTVCDHIDRSEIAKRGMAKVQEALAAAKAKREAM